MSVMVPGGRMRWQWSRPYSECSGTGRKNRESHFVAGCPRTVAVRNDRVFGPAFAGPLVGMHVPLFGVERRVSKKWTRCETRRTPSGAASSLNELPS
jgi:hypothetical protein